MFATGGAVDGPNLRGVPDRAVERLVGDPDRLARRAVDGGPVHRAVVLRGRRPSEVHPWVERDLRRFRQRLRNVTVNVSRRRVAAGDANPAAMLARELRSRRASLLDAPATYDGAADRARVAARAAYLKAVLAALDERAAKARKRNRGFLDAVGAESSTELADLTALGGRTHRPPASTLAGGVAVVPHGSPAYLTLSAVDHGTVPSVAPGRTYHPLTAKNTNLFAVPYGEAAEGVTDAVLGEGDDRVRLGTAAQSLRAANRTLARTPNATLRARRNRLQNHVHDSLRTVRRRALAVLRRETELGRNARTAVVDDAFSRWDSTATRGLAVANGSFAGAVAAEARRAGATGEAADLTDARLRTTLRAARGDRTVRVPAGVTNRTASATRSAARAAMTELVKAGLQNGTERAYRRFSRSEAAAVPAGLPVTPVPGYWYATVNAWTVTVRGQYRRFVATARVGPPGGGGATLRYVRDGSAVALDVDGDGDRERLGRSGRVDFETGTTVVVAVPPGPPGVGDTDGDADERSAGWPCPGDDDGGAGAEGRDCTAEGDPE